MAVEVILPKVDMDMETGTISRWYAKEGDQVTKGQLLFEIETDKAAMEVEAPASGKLSSVTAEEGAVVPVGQAVAWILAEGEEIVAVADEISPVSADEVTVTNDSATHSDDLAPSLVAHESAHGGLRATPLARRIAREEGLDLGAIEGTGPNGRIQRRDVEGSIGRGSLAPRQTSHDGSLHHVWLREGDKNLAPVVMLHGFASDLNSWRLLVQAASLNHPILGVDLPGHGLSPQRSIAAIDDLALAVEEILTELKIGGCILVGHSLGGAIATKIASRGKVGVKSLMLISSGGLGPEVNGAFIGGMSRAKHRDSLLPWLRKLFADEVHLSPSFIQATLSKAADEEKREAQRAIAEVLFSDDTQCFDVRSELDALQLPVRLIFGSNDQVIPSHHARGLSGKIGVHLFANCGHMPQIEERQSVARILEEIAAATR